MGENVCSSAKKIMLILKAPCTIKLLQDWLCNTLTLEKIDNKWIHASSNEQEFVMYTYTAFNKTVDNTCRRKRTTWLDDISNNIYAPNHLTNSHKTKHINTKKSSRTNGGINSQIFQFRKPYNFKEPN